MKWLSGRVIVAIAALAVLAISFVWTPSGFPDVPLCPFHKLTGLPCAGCGMTRGFCAISHGQMAAAWDFNAFSFLFYAVAVALALRPFAARSIPMVERLLYHRRVLYLTPLVICGMWAFGIVRMYRIMGH